MRGQKPKGLSRLFLGVLDKSINHLMQLFLLNEGDTDGSAGE